MDTICVYKDKLNEALTLVPSMSQAKRLEAVSYWNNAASHFQKMVNASSSTHDLSLPQSDATGQDSSLDLDYQQQANDINPTVILDSEEFSIGQSEQINPPTSDNIVDLTSDLSPSDTLTSQFQQQQTSSDAPLYDSEYFSSNMMGEMQQQLSPDHDEINHLSANDTLQRAYMNDVLATENNCAQTGSLAAVNTCPGNQYQPAHHTGDIALNNIVPGTSSCSNLDGMNPGDTQVPIDSSVFCPMPNSSIQMTSMRNTGVENSNVVCQSGVLPQANHTVRIPNASNDLVLCPRQPTSTHDIGNGQFDRGPGHPPRQQVQACQSTSTINMDPCFSMSTSVANMSRNDLFTQGVRPLQQIQISEQSQMESDYNVDARPRTTFFQQNQPCPDISNANQQQLVYLPPTNLATQPPPCTSTRFSILPQQSEVGVKMESMNYIEVCATTSNEQHTCELCGKSGFSTKGNLKRHRKAHAGEKPYQCEHCDSKFTEKKSLKIHLRRHTGEKPYKCTVCEKPFSQTGVLKSHMALHLEERKFNCDKCNKAFRQRSQLKLHLMRHDGIKKLECSRCMAKFLTKGDLERHFRIHTGERPYKCNMCEKTFTRQQSLNEHKNRHIGRKPFTCKYCDKSFSEMSASYKHAKVHKKEEQARAIDRVDP